MSMSIDKRVTVDRTIADQIQAAHDAIDNEAEYYDGEFIPNRNAIRRYWRLIRKISGCAYVTMHRAEHNPQFNAPSVTIAFGRYVK